MNGMQRTSGWSRNGWPPTRQHLSKSRSRADGGGRMPRRGRSGLATRHSSKPTATTGIRGTRLRKTLIAANKAEDLDGKIGEADQKRRAVLGVPFVPLNRQVPEPPD